VTEKEWLESTNLGKMLTYLPGKASARKLRLAAVSFARQVEHLAEDERSRHALDVAELYADGLASEDELVAARQAAQAAYDLVSGSTGRGGYGGSRGQTRPADCDPAKSAGRRIALEATHADAKSAARLSLCCIAALKLPASLFYLVHPTNACFVSWRPRIFSLKNA
jgi:hypothetical protein